MRGLLAILLLLGCGNNQSTSSEPAPAKKVAAPVNAGARARCAAAIGEAATTGRGGEQFSPEDQKFSAEIEAVMTDSCAATQWPEVILICLSNGTTREELNGCTEMLTPVQRQDMMERVLVVTKAHEAAPKPAVKPVP